MHRQLSSIVRLHVTVPWRVSNTARAILIDMRIAIITESFPPDVNGVANCVVRVAENLVRKGHHPLVIAPESAHDTAAADRRCPTRWNGCRRCRFPATRPSGSACRRRRPAAPSPGTAPRWSTWPARSRSARGAAGWPGRWTCRWSRCTRPTCRTTPAPTTSAGRRWRSPGAGCATSTTRPGRTLAPSSVTAADLRAHGLERVQLWGRGVDAERFHPARRDEGLRAEIAPNGEVIVGYVGPAGGREAGRPAGRRWPACRGCGSR